MAEFRPHAEKLKEAGINVFVIGSGAPNFARGFKERLEVDIPIFSDEKRVTYQALEMHRGVGTLLDPRMALKAAAIFKYRQRKTMGDATQQGGVIVVRPDGTMPFKFLSRFPGDHAKADDIVAAALSS